MIAIVYNGLKRFQKTANPNHQKMIERIRSKYPVTVYDFLKDSLAWFGIPVIRENLLESMKALKEKRRPKLI